MRAPEIGMPFGEGDTHQPLFGTLRADGIRAEAPGKPRVTKDWLPRLRIQLRLSYSQRLTGTEIGLRQPGSKCAPPISQTTIPRVGYGDMRQRHKGRHNTHTRWQTHCQLTATYIHLLAYGRLGRLYYTPMGMGHAVTDQRPAASLDVCVEKGALSIELRSNV